MKHVTVIGSVGTVSAARRGKKKEVMRVFVTG